MEGGGTDCADDDDGDDDLAAPETTSWPSWSDSPLASAGLLGVTMLRLNGGPRGRGTFIFWRLLLFLGLLSFVGVVLFAIWLLLLLVHSR